MVIVTDLERVNECSECVIEILKKVLLKKSPKRLKYSRHKS